MADSKAKGAAESEAASKGEDAEKIGHSGSELGQHGSSLNPQGSDHVQGPLSDSRGRRGSRSVAAQVTPPTPLKLRLSVAASGSGTAVAITRSVRPKPPTRGPALPRPSPSFFGSCFGGSAPPGQHSGKFLPSSRKQTCPPIRSCSTKPGVPTRQADTNKGNVLDPVAVAAGGADTSSAAASATSTSPSCSCSIPAIEAENAAKTAAAEQSVPLEPSAAAAAGDSASMSKAEDDPGVSGAQQVLNAEPETLIAAVKLADSESESRHPSPESSRPSAADSRQSATGVSPIRGLRPSYGEIRAPGRRQRSDPADDDPSPRARKSPYNRSRSPTHNNDLAPQATARGVERLFETIIGRKDSRRKEQALSQSPKRSTRRNPRSPNNHVRHYTSSNRSKERETESDERRLSSESPEASTSRGHTFSDLSDLPGISIGRDHEYPGDEIGGREQTMQEFDRRMDTRDARLLASDVRWKQHDPYRESAASKTKKDPRRRGHPDPSFNPRPGDIIIRARKRAGLRLTDFYYYDNENYMEPGDQILRAKFDYLPPMDKMYLWCRLYVYGADNTYTFLDSTSESIGKFGTGAGPGGADTRII